MSSRVGRVLVGMALVLSATACDDNPLAEDREEASYFRLNPSNVAVEAGGEVKVTATVLNKYGAATNAGVTATPCDAKISAVADTTRSDFEYPERFVVSGNTLGASCIVVRGGGITDTVDVRVIPGSLNATLDTLGSGESLTLSVQFFDANGNPVSGLGLGDLTYTSLSTTQAVVDSAGNVTGRAPGTGRVLVGLKSAWGATRVDTVTFTVRAGAFTGTVSPNSVAYEGMPVTFNAGAIPFDDDTSVQFNGSSTFVLSRSESQITALVPGGSTATTQFAITNMGPDQISAVGNITVVNPGQDQYEPNGSLATAKPISVGDTVYVTVSGDDTDDYFRLDVPTGMAITFNATWAGDSDVDVLIYTSTGALAATGCATGSKPENCAYNIPAGTWYVVVNMYEAHTPPAPPVRLMVVPFTG